MQAKILELNYIIGIRCCDSICLLCTVTTWCCCVHHCTM